MRQYLEGPTVYIGRDSVISSRLLKLTLPVLMTPIEIQTAVPLPVEPLLTINHAY